MANSNTIGTGEVANSIPTIVAAEALGYLKANTVLVQLVNRDYDSDVAQYGQTVSITSRGAISVNDKADDTVVTKQILSDSAQSVTLNKHKEVTFIVEDIAEMFSRPSILEGYASDGMAAIAEQMDIDLAALYSGFSQTIDASGGLAEANLRSARRLLNSAKAPLGGRSLVLHEDAEYELLAIEKFVNQDYRASLQGVPEGLLNSWQGRFLGFGVYMDQKITVATTCKNMAFHKDAMVFATRPLRQADASMGVNQKVMAEDGVGLRVTLSYDTDHLGPKLTLDVLYGVAELRDVFGITISTAEI